jgi:hypothetical protein
VAPYGLSDQLAVVPEGDVGRQLTQEQPSKILKDRITKGLRKPRPSLPKVGTEVREEAARLGGFPGGV